MPVDVVRYPRYRFPTANISHARAVGIRHLDKLIDELTKGRPMEKVLRKACEQSVGFAVDSGAWAAFSQ